MPEPIEAHSDQEITAASSGYAPFGQLVKMLLPSAGSIAVYNDVDEVLWCSDGYERPDLRGMLDSLRAAASNTLAGRGSVERTSAGVPAFVAALRGADARPLGSLVVELGRSNSRNSPSMLASMLRPVLDCLETHMDVTRPVAAEKENTDAGSLDLLLSVDEDDHEDASALQHLLRHCVQHLGCVMGALLVPDKNLAVTSALDASLGGGKLLDRTQKHLLAWAQLNNRPMVVNRVANADVAPYKILSCPVRDLKGRVVGLVALFRAASAEDFELRDIRILEFVSRKAVGILNSQYDALSGLVNRLIFERRAQTLLDSGTADGGALLYVDIDRLEAINAAFGFHAGDEVIQRVADVLRRIGGDTATVSRVGGDRFALLLPQSGLAAVQEIGKKILSATAQLGYLSGVDAVPVTVSIGAVLAGRRHERVAHLLAAAELACKRAKQQGRNRLVAEEAGQTSTTSGNRQALAATTLHEALKSNDFRLEAQPIVGLRVRAGETVGYELLVRMRNAAGELLAPDKFLDAAERYELLPALDRWVLCSAVETLRGHEQGLGGAGFTINVSAQSLASRKYAEFALEQLGQAGLSPASFCFEIKEAAAVNHIAAAELFIRDLTAAGCKIALDNFGCGLSSLAHLKRLPVHSLKIDGRFVRRVVDDRIAASIVSGIARAARTLGVGVIAEHVETAAIADKLRELDVDFGQGFHFGRPQPLGGLTQAFDDPSVIRLTTGL